MTHSLLFRGSPAVVLLNITTTSGNLPLISLTARRKSHDRKLFSLHIQILKLSYHDPTMEVPAEIIPYTTDNLNLKGELWITDKVGI